MASSIMSGATGSRRVRCTTEVDRSVPILLQNAIRLLIECTTDRIAFRTDPSAGNPYPRVGHCGNHVLYSLPRRSSKRLLQQNRHFSDLARTLREGPLLRE